VNVNSNSDEFGADNTGSGLPRQIQFSSRSTFCFSAPDDLRGFEQEDASPRCSPSATSLGAGNFEMREFCEPR